MLGLHIIALAFLLVTIAGFYLYWTIGIAILIIQFPFWWTYFWTILDIIIDKLDRNI